MSARPKFLFDLDFAAPSGGAKAATIPLAAHEAALAEAEARGYRNGVSAAEAQERTKAERQTAAAFERISAAVSRLATELPAIAGRVEAEAVEVAVAVAKKLAPALIGAEPMAELSGLVAGCLRELTAAPHVAIRVNEGLYAAARERFGEIARSCGFEGRLVVLGEPEIAPGDCRIEWADGGLIRNRAAIEAAVDEAVGRYLARRRGEA